MLPGEEELVDRREGAYSRTAAPHVAGLRDGLWGDDTRQILCLRTVASGTKPAKFRPLGQ